MSIYLDHLDADTAAVVALLRRHRMERSVVVYGGPDRLREWRRLAPRIPLMPSLPREFRRPGGIAEFLRSCPADALDGHASEWTRDLVDEAYAAGVKVYADIQGPTDTPGEYLRALAMGVDGLQTDYPDRLLAALRRRR